MKFENQVFQSKTIFLDGQDFVRCRFEGCRIEFAGVIGGHLEECTFAGCTWELTGPAATTISFLTGLYSQGAKKLIEATFDKIRSGQHPDGAAQTFIN